MLTIFRRHLKSCAQTSRTYRRCRCPISVEGTLEGKEFRQALGTNSWERASELVREWEATGKPATGTKDTTPKLPDAVEKFLADAKARNMKEPTISKYRVLTNQLQNFADGKGLQLPSDFSLPVLRDFRETWPDSPISASKKLERLRSLFGFFHDSGWVKTNEAKLVKKPLVADTPTLPFTDQELTAIFDALDRYPDNYGRTGQENAVRLRSFVLTLRWSGLRIRDVTTLKRSALADGRLMLHTQKTNTHVWLPLHPDAVKALENCPSPSQEYFFWTGASNPKSAVGDWQRSLRKLFKLADVPTGHAHRFRDTFSVTLLAKGVPIEEVSILLGHKSVLITQKHYAPWVLTRQTALEESVRKTW